MRQGWTLNQFIQGLSPVPFVRPSIRSFVAQLAAGSRSEFRKQLRTVLMGDHAFHIRRLVAECLAEQAPQDDDWLLLSDLREKHRDVFQVIYTQAVRVEWHTFWMKHLIPVLKNQRDAEGVMIHMHRVSRWKNDDAPGVLAFWTEVLELDWVDKTAITRPLAAALADVPPPHIALFASLLLKLLKLPQPEHSMISYALAHAVAAGAVADEVLWHYIVDEVNEEDIRAYRFGQKLRCDPYEFGYGSDKFLEERMRQSTALLNLALEALERWGAIRRAHYGEAPRSYWSGFLQATSYGNAHSPSSPREANGEYTLLAAIEAAIVQHAIDGSDWWRENRERLCGSAEGALRYFAILACTAVPSKNLESVYSLLNDKVLLESDLSYELGTLLEAACVYFEETELEAVQTTVLALHQKDTSDEVHDRRWMLDKQAQLLLAIPCHLRIPTAQVILDENEQAAWPLMRQPHIEISGGVVSAPFSFEVFLAASDAAVLRLLNHYKGYVPRCSDDFLTGGEREVRVQLHQAASRAPVRFLRLLSVNWAHIAEQFCDEIMGGVATYLAHRYGNLQANGIWLPIENPNAETLARQILDELARHPAYWHKHRAASNALQACAYVVQESEDVEQLIFLAAGFATLGESRSVWGEGVDLVTAGINMSRGHIAEALMIVAIQLTKKSQVWPALLEPMLRLFAADEDPAIRALLLRHLPYLQSQYLGFGWELFTLVMHESAPGLWSEAEPCLYYAYHQHFEVVAPWLEQIYREGRGKDLEVWGRISALATLEKRQERSTFLAQLDVLDATEAWQGAASVWTYPENFQRHREECLAGLDAGLHTASQQAGAVAQACLSLVQDAQPLVAMPTTLLQRCFSLFEEGSGSVRLSFYAFSKWVNALSLCDSKQALEAVEIYLHFVQRTKIHIYDPNHDFVQLLTRLFAQAEEEEELDGGAMLKRVVAIQDRLLVLGLTEVNEWLKAAERPS